MKCGCEFSLKAVYDKNRFVWKLIVINEKHNHAPAKFLEGHAYARRLTADDLGMVQELYLQSIPTRNILPTIKARNQDNLSVAKDIHNVIQKIRAEKNVGVTPMQVLENLLSKRYTYHTRENPITNAVEEIFFVHLLSYPLWRAFPSILLIDTTYKTNRYNMPFVQVVGVTSTGKSFSIANAFIYKEREENFTWVLQRLKEMLNNYMEPRVIVTDRDLALINTCNKIFPNPYKSLCRFHIQSNIAKKCVRGFTREQWNKFLYF